MQEATTTTAPTTSTTTVEATTSTERPATIAAARDDSGTDGDDSFAIPLLVSAALVVTGVVGAMVLRSRGRA